MAKKLLAATAAAALVAFFGFTETGRNLGCRAVADSATCTLQAAERLGQRVDDALKEMNLLPAPRKDVPAAKQWDI